MSSIEGGDLQPKKCSFEWKIKRFYADCEKVGDGHKSPLFPIHYPNKRTNWWLEVYPKGYEEEYKDSLSLFLCYESHSFTDVTVDFQVSIVSKQNILPEMIESHTFLGTTDFGGWCEFEKQDVIKDAKTGALVDDTLTILCEITFHSFHFPYPLVSEKLEDYNILIDKIGTGIKEFEQLLENNCCSDVTFYIANIDYGTMTMHLHRAILMCRSPVFHAMFEQDVKEKKKSFVEITDIGWSEMEELFRFIYTNNVQYLNKIAESLLIAADKYGVTELKALCERQLYHDLTVSNAISYLKLTEKCNTIHLKTLTVEFVADHYKDVVGKAEFEDLPNSIMCDIFRALAAKA